MAWLSYVLGREKIRSIMRSSKAVESVFNCLDSDFAHAFVIFVPVLPIFYISQHGRDYINSWKWKNVLVWVHYWALLYFIFEVGFCKATHIILAYTNQMLKGLPLYIVATATFFICFFLFMLPPTPGAPVYMIVGIIVVRSAQQSGWSFVAAVCLAVAVGFAVKMSFAAAAQKWIGSPLGNNNRVRYLCQIHTMEMRAFEKVVAEKQMTLAKVGMLIGGPDWPMAVICGILHLPLLPILLAITPVLIQSVIPCVLSGALITADEKELRELGGTCLAVAAALQILAGLVAMYYFQRTIEKDFVELSKEREGDKELLELDRKNIEKEQFQDKLVAWPVLPCYIKAVLLLGVVLSECMLGTFYTFHCFKKFDSTNSIDEDLGGNPFNIINPLGYVGISFFAGAMLCLVFYELWAAYTIRDADHSGAESGSDHPEE